MEKWETPIFRGRACGERGMGGSYTLSLEYTVLRMHYHNFQLQDLQSGDTFTAHEVSNLYLHDAFPQMNTLFSLPGDFYQYSISVASFQRIQLSFH